VAINFFFPAGETTFVVGASGSGKSTLANLLMKYYSPAQGDILIDGRPIDTLNADWLRKNITLVQQQSVLFNETVLQNIAFGRRDDVTRADIMNAGKTSDLDQTLVDLPQGLDTLVGPNGKSLSGGQQQRIAIARARLRDAPIVILDEATSALDPKSREKVMTEVRSWRKGKTTIIITHDVSQIQDTEYVYVLEHGVVVQEGHRQELAEKMHGAFASFLPSSQIGADDSIDPCIRRQSEPFSAVSAVSGGAQSLGYISKTFGLQETLPPNNFNVRGSQLFSLGTATAHASEVLANKIWSTPIPQNEDGVFQPFHSSTARRLSVPFLSSNVDSSAVSNKSRLIQLGKGINNQGSHILPHHLTSLTKKARLAKPSPALILDTSIYGGQLLLEQPNQSTGIQMRAQPPKPSKKKLMSLTNIFATIWPILAWTDRATLVLGFLSSTCVAAATPAFAFVFAQLLSIYYLPSDQTAQARRWALALLGIALVDGVATYYMHYALENTGQAWVNALRLEALKRILAQPKSWFDEERNAPAKLNDTLDRNAEEMRNLIGRFAGLIFTAALMLIISIVWSTIISWKLTLLTIACGPIIYANTWVFNWVSGRWEHKCNKASDHTASIFTETFANIRVVRALTLEEYFNRKHTKAVKDTYSTGISRAAYSGTLFGVGDSISYFVIATIFYYGTTLVSSGKLGVTSTIEVINLLIFGLANTMSMMSLVPQINSSRTTAARMIYLANLPQRASHETTGTRRLTTPFPIVFRELSFSYSNKTSIKTLSNITMTITAGSCTALVGPSGSGKSTIASILLGLYPPDWTSLQPSLTIASIPIQNCNITALRSFISIVPQSPLLFPTTILSNIIYGLPEGSPFANSFSATQAAKDVGIHDFIMSLPNGYATVIGEGGMGISGGQAQRMAIARALVRRPKILILDEATSALDAVSAEVIRETTKKLIQRGREAGEGGTAVLLISHSIEMMKIANRVVVMEDGVVKETGTFDELRKKGGAFTRLIGRWDGDPGNGNEDSSETVLEEMRKMMTPVDGREKENWPVGARGSI
jgi:ATP-binding cassette subfamily B (MDR/TAP) protein 1